MILASLTALAGLLTGGGLTLLGFGLGVRAKDSYRLTAHGDDWETITDGVFTYGEVVEFQRPVRKIRVKR